MFKQITFNCFLLLAPGIILAQRSDGRLKFQQGQIFEIILQTKTTIAQQAMGQAIDFNVDATGTHAYRVTNTTDDNHTLNHTVKRITFLFDGMGQKLSFDSDIPKDMNGQFGKPVKEMLEKKYDMIIDPYGKVLMTMPDSFASSLNDSRMAIITSMMKDVVEIVQPPKKGKGSVFRVIPEKEGGVGVGDSWTESGETVTEKFDITYVITAITDTTIAVDFTGGSTTIMKAEMMGNETTTTMQNKSTGKITLDKVTGIIREKTITTDSNGNTETPFGTLPVISKTITTVIVRAVQ
ncbi:MAG: hypothetical protein JNK27_06110 [Chitinophagaceae bacterium]|nr:hypothetical protein [Chitinophagaceae bacterium]